MNMQSIEKVERLYDDSPIDNLEQDRFGRNSLAEMIADSIIDLAKSKHRCKVYGIYGKWGEGKTSLLNLVESRLRSSHMSDNLYVINYNPWLVNSGDAVLLDYFSEIIKDTGLKFIKKDVKKYFKLLLNFIPNYGSALSRLIEGICPTESLSQSKNLLSAKIVEKNIHCLVMIDDIDRLDKMELHAVMRLVRQVADFDNFIYVMAMDVDIVSKSIGSYFGDGNSYNGRKFIDKIVQVPIVLPQIQEDTMKELVKERLREILNDSYLGNERPQEIDSISFIIYPAIRTMRELYRYCNQLAFVLSHLKGEVSISDLCILEAIKLISHEAYQSIYNNRMALMRDPHQIAYYLDSDDRYDRIEKEYDKAESKVVENLDAETKKVVARLLRHLFGDKSNTAFSESNFDNKRLCTSVYFNKYFTLLVPSNIIADAELDDMASKLENMPIEVLSTWVKIKHQKYSNDEIKRSLDYLLKHCGDQKSQCASASRIAMAISSFYESRGSASKEHDGFGASSFVAYNVIGEYLFVQDPNNAGYLIGDVSLINATLSEIFRNTKLNFALNLLSCLRGYISGSEIKVMPSLQILKDRVSSLSSEELSPLDKRLINTLPSFFEVLTVKE